MAEYIERYEAIEFIKHNTPNVNGETTVKCVIRSLKNVPTADVAEVKHGKWDGNIIGFCNVCMECGAIVERTAVKSHTGKLNYCPSCGARMDGEGE